MDSIAAHVLQMWNQCPSYRPVRGLLTGGREAIVHVAAMQPRHVVAGVVRCDLVTARLVDEDVGQLTETFVFLREQGRTAIAHCSLFARRACDIYEQADSREIFGIVTE